MRSEVTSAEYVVGELDLRPSLQMLLSQTPCSPLLWGKAANRVQSSTHLEEETILTYRAAYPGVDSYSRPGGFSGTPGHWGDGGDLTPLLRPADH